jgi:hypothetical protein
VGLFKLGPRLILTSSRSKSAHARGEQAHQHPLGRVLDEIAFGIASSVHARPVSIVAISDARTAEQGDARKAISFAQSNTNLLQSHPSFILYQGPYLQTG